MTSWLIDALALPPEARVDQRVPKKLLVEQGVPTATDKRQIQDGIEELLWVAALKANTIGVSEYRDDIREYLEIAVLSLKLRQTAKATRMTELIHRAIPYPVVLISAQGDNVNLSLAHKRHAQNEAGKVVLEDAVVSCPVSANSSLVNFSDFLDGLSLAAQPRANLYELYKGWLAHIEALQAAQLTGCFTSAPSPEAVAARREALAVHTRLQREVAMFRAQAEKESQLNRRVEFNLEIKRLEAELARAAGNL